MFLIIFLVRQNCVNWPGYSVISAGVRGTRLRAWSAFGAFAHAGLDGSRAGGMVSGISPAVGGDPIILVVRDTSFSRVRIVIQVVPVGDTVYLSAGKVHCCAMPVFSKTEHGREENEKNEIKEEATDLQGQKGAIYKAMVRCPRKAEVHENICE